ncbi:MAG: Ldh family oxidoreductase, partial [Geminicoccaceae bacterium]
MPITSKRIFRAGDLSSFVAALFRAAGLEASKAEVVGKLLLEADLMGHSTHGLQLVPAYLTAADKGTMTGVGEPEVIADRGAVVTWDGQR